MMSNQNNMLEHYRSRYFFYKEKCKKMEYILERFQELLDVQAEAASFQPLDSPPVPEALSSHPILPEEDEMSPPKSPILGGSAKRRLQFATKEPEHSDSKCLEDDDNAVDYDFLCGSNKWEFEEPENLEVISSSPSTPQKQQEEGPRSLPEQHPKASSSSPLKRLKELRAQRFSGLRLTKGVVSKNIRGVQRRMLPGQPCDECEDYYKAAGLGEDFIRRASRHRCTHRRQKSPKGYWELNLDRFQTKPPTS